MHVLSLYTYSNLYWVNNSNLFARRLRFDRTLKKAHSLFLLQNAKVCEKTRKYPLEVSPIFLAKEKDLNISRVNILLQIEELMLHMIEQNEKIKALNQKVQLSE